MASDIFAKIGDVKGESADARHKDEIEVLSFSWGLNNPGNQAASGGVAAGKATFHDLSFVHYLDKASPVLMQACATGTRYKEVIITHRKAGQGQKEYLIVKLTDVSITSVTHGGGSGQPPSENVTLAFGGVDFEYKPQKADGSLDTGVHFKFDLKTGRPG